MFSQLNSIENSPFDQQRSFLSYFHGETRGNQTFGPVEFRSMNTQTWFNQQHTFIIRPKPHLNQNLDEIHFEFYLENLIK